MMGPQVPIRFRCWMKARADPSGFPFAIGTVPSPLAAGAQREDPA